MLWHSPMRQVAFLLTAVFGVGNIASADANLEAAIDAGIIRDRIRGEHLVMSREPNRAIAAQQNGALLDAGYAVYAVGKSATILTVSLVDLTGSYNRAIGMMRFAVAGNETAGKFGTLRDMADAMLKDDESLTRDEMRDLAIILAKDIIMPQIGSALNAADDMMKLSDELNRRQKKRSEKVVSLQINLASLRQKLEFANMDLDNAVAAHQEMPNAWELSRMLLDFQNQLFFEELARSGFSGGSGSDEGSGAELTNVPGC